MQIIPLLPIPRQRLTVTLENIQFDITIVAVGDCMYATILRAGVAIVSGARCVGEFQIMPSRYQEGAYGNFAFQTDDEENPQYLKFGTSHFLLYATAAELATARADYALI